jgi:hypothetical protein
LASIQDGAVGAPFIGGHIGHALRFDEKLNITDDGERLLAVGVVEGNIDALLAFKEIEPDFRDGDFEHFFEAKGLSGGLEERVCFAAISPGLILDRSHLSELIQLDDVANAIQAQGFAPDGKGAVDGFSALFAGCFLVHSAVLLGAFEREEVFFPDCFEVDEGASARTKAEVGQGGDGDHLSSFKLYFVRLGISCEMRGIISIRLACEAKIETWCF